MGCFHNCLFQHGSQQFIILLLFLLISTVTHFRFMAEGRAISRQLSEASEAQMGRKEYVEMARSMIGSRPPRCDKKCNNCGHCEAVQVPVAPQLIKTQLNAKGGHHLFANPSIAYSRGDDLSNYKPMSWKCKCGDLLFNP